MVINTPHMDRMPQTEMAQAAQLAVDQLKAQGVPIADHRLVEASNVLRDSPHLWRMTFKLRRLIPERLGQEVGKGGETFIEVDLMTRRARLVGAGE